MPGFGNLTIGNLIIMLVCNQSEEGKYQLLNFFGEHNLCLCCKFVDDREDPVLSPYIQLKKEEFLTISNINYTGIIESIVNAPKSKVQDEYANLLVLEILKAYDEQKEKNLELQAYFQY